ncbi:hypothetical protein CYMTET_22422 [Cymbomonas tetramitiformis]|uniref:Uncharacterized protein n=1 Tax=Cymbomonas tetramitiformis TaxID=36881 RepID=A0AAE0L205_9CHLO|nr:hypothetical protein CYMTET_22422 [Cymbomonas tetramitiformis]
MKSNVLGNIHLSTSYASAEAMRFKVTKMKPNGRELELEEVKCPSTEVFDSDIIHQDCKKDDAGLPGITLGLKSARTMTWRSTLKNIFLLSLFFTVLTVIGLVVHDITLLLTYQAVPVGSLALHQAELTFPESGGDVSMQAAFSARNRMIITGVELEAVHCEVYATYNTIAQSVTSPYQRIQAVSDSGGDSDSLDHTHLTKTFALNDHQIKGDGLTGVFNNALAQNFQAKDGKVMMDLQMEYSNASLETLWNQSQSVQSPMARMGLQILQRAEQVQVHLPPLDTHLRIAEPANNDGRAMDLSIATTGVVIDVVKLLNGNATSVTVPVEGGCEFLMADNTTQGCFSAGAAALTKLVRNRQRRRKLHEVDDIGASNTLRERLWHQLLDYITMQHNNVGQRTLLQDSSISNEMDALLANIDPQSILMMKMMCDNVICDLGNEIAETNLHMHLSDNDIVLGLEMGGYFNMSIQAVEATVDGAESTDTESTAMYLMWDVMYDGNDISKLESKFAYSETDESALLRFVYWNEAQLLDNENNIPYLDVYVAGSMNNEWSSTDGKWNFDNDNVQLSVRVSESGSELVNADAIMGIAADPDIYWDFCAYMDGLMFYEGEHYMEISNCSIAMHGMDASEDSEDRVDMTVLCSAKPGVDADGDLWGTTKNPTTYSLHTTMNLTQVAIKSKVGYDNDCAADYSTWSATCAAAQADPSNQQAGMDCCVQAKEYAEKDCNCDGSCDSQCSGMLEQVKGVCDGVGLGFELTTCSQVGYDNDCAADYSTWSATCAAAQADPSNQQAGMDCCVQAKEYAEKDCNCDGSCDSQCSGMLEQVKGACDGVGLGFELTTCSQVGYDNDCAADYSTWSATCAAAQADPSNQQAGMDCCVQAKEYAEKDCNCDGSCDSQCSGMLEQVKGACDGVGLGFELTTCSQGNIQSRRKLMNGESVWNDTYVRLVQKDQGLVPMCGEASFALSTNYSTPDECKQKCDSMDDGCNVIYFYGSSGSSPECGGRACPDCFYDGDADGEIAYSDGCELASDGSAEGFDIFTKETSITGL